MKELVILSGKGGTGKTTLGAALAHLASQEYRLILADADVDASNLELIVGADVQERHDFRGGKLAIVEPASCTACGRCAEVCRFDAIVEGETYAVDPIRCEGCAVCFYQCPEEAIRLEEALDGYWFLSRSRYGPLVHGALRAGRENSGKLVSVVKEQARRLAQEQDAALLLLDGPPGIGCPVIASLAGVHLTLVVTEPTVAGFHDLERIVGVARHFQVPLQVCLNKADLSAAGSEEVRRFCVREGIDLVGEIPFDPGVTQAMVQGWAVTDTEARTESIKGFEGLNTVERNWRDGPAAAAVREIWERVRARLLVE